MAEIEFTRSIDCTAGGAAHKHELVIRACKGVHGSSTPQPIRLHYQCPVAASGFMVRVIPPIDAARPFDVTEVR